MLAEKNVYINKAYDKLQVISMDKQKQMEYTARQKELLDYNQLMKESKEAGYKDGQNKAALNSIKAGLTDDIIARITDLSLDEIKKLRTTIV